MIPDFLKLENIPIVTDNMKEVIEEYEKHFGEGISNETMTFSREELIKMLKKCIKKNKTIEQLYGIRQDFDEDVDL